MKKIVKIILMAVTALILCAAVVFMLLSPIQAEVQGIGKGVLTQDFTESGKLISAKNYLVSSGVGGVVVSRLEVLEGQRVSRGDLLVTLEPGALEETLQSQMKQLEQRRLGLEAQKKMTQAERTVAVEQARTAFESTKWEYERLYNEEWGVADNITDTAVENMLQARYTWQDLQEGDDVGMQAGRAHSLYRQAMDNLMIARTDFSDPAKAYYDALLLSNQKILSALEGNKAAVESVDAAIAELDASAELLKTQLATSEIRAPFDGVVHGLAVTPGQAVTALAPILSVASEDKLEVEAYLLASDAMELRVGDMVVCELENGEDFSGQVTFVAAGAQERVSTVGIVENRCLVRIAPQQLPKGVSAGFGVDVKFSVLRAENVYAVPLSAVVSVEGGDAVYLLRGGKAVLTPVTKGIIGGGYTELSQGVTDGDQVILLPQELGIKNGSLVKAAG